MAEHDAEAFVHESVARSDPDYTWARERSRLKRWLNKLPRPVGVVACYDIKAQQLLDLCREQDIAVPEELAVIGVDNDELLCDLAEPPLTSGHLQYPSHRVSRPLHCCSVRWREKRSVAKLRCSSPSAS